MSLNLRPDKFPLPINLVYMTYFIQVKFTLWHFYHESKLYKQMMDSDFLGFKKYLISITRMELKSVFQENN